MLYYITPELHGARDQGTNEKERRNLPRANLPWTDLGEALGYAPSSITFRNTHICHQGLYHHHSRCLSPLLSWAGKGCPSFGRTGTSDLH